KKAVMRLHHGLVLLCCEQDGTAKPGGSTRQPPAIPRGAQRARQAVVCKDHIRPPVLWFACPVRLQCTAKYRLCKEILHKFSLVFDLFRAGSESFVQIPHAMLQ